MQTAFDQLQKVYGTFHRVNRILNQKVEDRIEVFEKGDYVIKINYSSGRLRFIDKANYHNAGVARSVSSIDIGLLQGKAKEIFRTYLGDRLKNSYVYRFRKYIHKVENESGTQKEGIYEVAVALNQTVNGVPIIGSGGKDSIHLLPDGTLVKLDFHFVNFVEVPAKTVSIYGNAEGEGKLNAEMVSQNLQLDEHVVSRKEFGYFLRTAKGSTNWLIPTYAYFVIPAPGVMDKMRIYTYPASDDPEILKMVEEDTLREERRKANRVQVEFMPEDHREKPDGDVDPINPPHSKFQ